MSFLDFPMSTHSRCKIITSHITSFHTYCKRWKTYIISVMAVPSVEKDNFLHFFFKIKFEKGFIELILPENKRHH